MTYSNKTAVETWSQTSTGNLGATGYDYDNTLEYLINVADRAIDDYCGQPEGFFNAGGIEIQQEYHDGVEIGDYGLMVNYPFSIKRRPFLRFKYSPVLSVTKLEKADSSGTWSTLTEGKTSDYLVMENGVRFIRSVPTYDYKNIRVTYKIGYTATPGRVGECSARLAAALAHRIIDSKDRSSAVIQGQSTSKPDEHKGLAKPVFTSELKLLVRRYRRKVPVKLL
jgi:hypothetical protein